MKIGVSTLAINNNELYENLKILEELNIDYIEILLEYPNSNIDTDLLNSFNFTYTVHSPIIDLNIASLNKSIQMTSINEIVKSIGLANSLDSDIVVVHPGSVPFLARNHLDKVLAKCRESLVTLDNYAKDNGVSLAVENMPNIDSFLYKDINELNKLLNNLDMSMTLDIGHGAVTGFSENQMYFDSVKHIHLSDNNHDHDMHYGLGEGSIDFKTIIDIFEKNKYDGIYVIEVNNMESVIKSIEYLKKLNI
ncbi:sugar phosphate isomerase/epimerase [Methanobrevibacter sp. TMH8]|uniref:sugar phosphate isomerase/epimerase family protein n=1 Tax=Methanobrevibacter sp. TMH8 TaxID=2848611 RepID=UPI001CCA1781|nr:sugar phosphate isomerase/epimerase [Methanobrevibacter sp. TMH8]MBZ9570912.1 sugar phosphate isomerase/epimerase [Methanobrevibacter sp. TMH8]